jgi:phospholipid transport system substrate-binding protein
MKIYNLSIKIYFTVAVVILLFFLELPITQASEITDGVKNTIDSIIDIVSKEELKNDAKKPERRQLIREVVSKKFSYYEMSRRSLAKHWKKRTPKEKKEFMSLFGKLLENSYANKIESYTDEKIIYVKELVKGNVALVKTIIQKNDDAIPVDYKLIKVDNDWKIYDFIVEGVSMIRNYRTQFKKIIHKSSYEELVSKLKKKVDNISNNNVESDKLSS